MDGACSTHGGDEKCVQNFGRKAWTDETKEDQGVFGGQYKYRS
jgi:hypothetical protein